MSDTAGRLSTGLWATLIVLLLCTVVFPSLMEEGVVYGREGESTPVMEPFDALSSFSQGERELLNGLGRALDPSIGARIRPVLFSDGAHGHAWKGLDAPSKPPWLQQAREKNARMLDWLLPLGATVVVITGTYLLFSLRSR